MPSLHIGVFLSVLAAMVLGNAPQALAQQAIVAPTEIPEVLRGPFVSDPDVITLLDKVDPRGCKYSGPLVFSCLIQQQAERHTQEEVKGALVNPFNLQVTTPIVATIMSDLREFGQETNDGDSVELDAKFLTNASSKVELVGIVNRMDRQFVGDQIPGHEAHNACGEISIIYRFGYTNGSALGSRLPVTMNVVFPAIPTNNPYNLGCADIASRWLAMMRETGGKKPEAIVSKLQDAKTGILSPIAGADIFRIELNFQAYRIKVGTDTTKLGSTAKYAIRVFRWDPHQQKFVVSHLHNQIDRARLLGDLDGDENSCTRKVDPSIKRADFVAWLSQPDVMADIDRGTLTIPQKYLACRAVSVSPGGPHRSLNQPFWKAPQPQGDIISDQELSAAIKAFEAAPKRDFSFVRSVDDVRTRLNETTCSGCHQTRAIAGFHFPGADRRGTPSFNAVFLPGSAHFYGDQARRLAILNAFVTDKDVDRYALALSYAGRPLNKFKQVPWRMDKITEILGGWGSTCLIPSATSPSKRDWSCNDNLKCDILYKSDNAPGLGTCVPNRPTEIGDSLQKGTIVTESFGREKYIRTDPKPVTSDTRVVLPDGLKISPPNSYYAAHQEYYEGFSGNDNTKAGAERKRDSQTGGFPSGMLRLSECIGLPSEATCGLTAVSGFASCIDKGSANVAACFIKFTAYAGLRACNAATPCRDDYICLQPISGLDTDGELIPYTLTTGKGLFEQRAKALESKPGPFAFGEKMPDVAWLSRNRGLGDGRGYCMPPYFVFQFRVDGHPVPKMLK